MPDFDNEADPQDGAEVLDETNLTEDGDEIANFDTMADVYDATSAEGDDDTEELEAEEDEADFDDEEADLIALSDGEDRDDEGLRPERDRLPSADNNRNEVNTMSAEPRSFESDADKDTRSAEDLSPEEKEALPYDDERKPPEHDPHTDKQLDHGLKETFPASDPVSINPGAD